MANTISTMAINPFKGLVSKQRKRYQKDGFNLDLTYIQPNLIAMGFPAEKLESVYRNDIYDVKKFLEIHHPNKYKVYNLCSERKYDPNRFEHFSYYPFDDHNPPNIKLIRDFCDDVQKWLSADTQNVAAVHCKAGKGRTGTMICCYLLHVGTFSTADEALNCYGQERTHDKKGVTIPSQRRYVDYYAYLLKSEKQYSPVSLQICELKLSPPPLLNSNQGTIYFSISDTQKKIHCAPIPDFKKSDPYVLIKLDQCIPLVGDIKVEFCQRKKLCKDKLFHFWFNTFFVDELAEVQEDKRLVYSLAKCELDDAHKDKSCKIFVQDFKVEVVMHKIESGTFSNPYKLQMGLGLGQEKIHASTKSNNCHQKNNSFSNHILASLSGNNGKNHNLVLSPCSVVAGGIENNFPPDHHLGLGSMGIDVVDCPNSATATAAAAQDAIRTPSEGNSETLSSSSEPSLSGEEWESEPEIGNLIQHASSENNSSSAVTTPTTNNCPPTSTSSSSTNSTATKARTANGQSNMVQA